MIAFRFVLIIVKNPDDNRRFQCARHAQAICVLPDARRLRLMLPQNGSNSQILNLLPAELEAVSVRFSPEKIDGAVIRNIATV